jgi:hypothetical protein
MAEHLREQGRKEGLETGVLLGELRTQRQVLVQVLRHRFGKIPATLVKRIEATEQLDRLQAWFAQALTAKKLDEVDFTAE